MADSSIEVTFRPPDLVRRMQRYPDKLHEEMGKTMTQSLAHLQGSVPPYPPAWPSSSYRRTGTLGRSIGLGGRADIYEVKSLGSGGYEARLGTRLNYAPQVIGPNDQLPLFKARGWWTLRTALDKAKPGIERLFQAMVKRLAAYLEGQG